MSQDKPATQPPVMKKMSYKDKKLAVQSAMANEVNRLVALAKPIQHQLAEIEEKIKYLRSRLSPAPKVKAEPKAEKPKHQRKAKAEKVVTKAPPELEAAAKVVEAEAKPKKSYGKLAQQLAKKKKEAV